jgi:hypothetical protein
VGPPAPVHGNDQRGIKDVCAVATDDVDVGFTGTVKNTTSSTRQAPGLDQLSRVAICACRR